MTITTRTDKGSALTHAEMDANLGYLVPPGAVMAFAMNGAPAGWLECSGAAVSRTLYAGLFAAIGTTFGAGNGSTTFNLPNLRGEFIRGWDNSRGVDTSRTFGSSQAESLGPHTHPVTDPGHGHSGSTGGAGGHSHSFTRVSGPSATGSLNTDYSRGPSAPDGSTASVGDHSHSVSVSGNTTGISIGSAGGTENRPRNIAMMYCIKI